MRPGPKTGALRAAWIAAGALLSSTTAAAPPASSAQDAAAAAALVDDAPGAAADDPTTLSDFDSALLDADVQPDEPAQKPSVRIATRPPPLHVDYAQYGVALAAEVSIDPGDACTDEPGIRFEPCILGSGGGLSIRGGYRSPGPWYIGGAYEFTKMDSSNLYRLGIFQQLRAEMRYMPDIGYRVAPYFTAGLGGVAYGNEWGVETGGALVFIGAGIELEVSRYAVLGVGCVYKPVLLAGWVDTAGHERATAIAQFVGFEFLLEVRSEFGRR